MIVPLVALAALGLAAVTLGKKDAKIEALEAARDGRRAEALATMETLAREGDKKGAREVAAVVYAEDAKEGLKTQDASAVEKAARLLEAAGQKAAADKARELAEKAGITTTSPGQPSATAATTEPEKAPRTAEEMRERAAVEASKGNGAKSAGWQKTAETQEKLEKQVAKDAEKIAEKVAKTSKGKAATAEAIKSNDPTKQEETAAKLEAAGEERAAAVVRATADALDQRQNAADALTTAETAADEEKSGKAEQTIAAQAVVETVKKGKYKEDRPTVKRYQLLAGLKPDSKYGPKTAGSVLAILGPIATPDPLYWPAPVKQQKAAWRAKKGSA